MDRFSLSENKREIVAGVDCPWLGNFVEANREGKESGNPWGKNSNCIYMKEEKTATIFVKKETNWNTLAVKTSNTLVNTSIIPWFFIVHDHKISSGK